jgi:hypothetical protein
VFASTTSNDAGVTNYAHRPGIIADGKWHLAIFDMTAFETSKEFIADKDGNYFPKFLRLDMFNSGNGIAWTTDDYIDIAFVGMSGDLSEIYAINSDIVDSNGNELPDPNAVPAPLPLYFDGEKINKGSLHGFKGNEVMEEGGKSFVRLYGNGESIESRITLLNSTGVATGQYVVIKYRMAESSADLFAERLFDIFTSTENEGPTGNDQAYFGGIKADGEWHIMVVDISKFSTNKAFTAVDGVYTAKYVSFDCFNPLALDQALVPVPEETYIDIEYIGMTGNVEDVNTLAEELGEYILIESNIDAGQKVVEVTPKAE